MSTRATASEPCIKGAVIREMMLWYEDRYGRGSIEHALSRVPGEWAVLLDPREPAFGVLASGWYPMSLTHPIFDAVMDGRTDEGRSIARDANAYVVPRMIRGLYKVLFDMAATPERYARHIPSLWRRLHTTGDRILEIRAPGEAFSVVERWPGHHPMLCWMTIYTMAFVFEKMGYKTWEVERVACVSHGGTRCETMLRYER